VAYCPGDGPHLVHQSPAMSRLRWAFKVMNAVHPWLYRRSGGRGVFAQVQGMPVLLLTTTGRRSGKPSGQSALPSRTATSIAT
jgi:hypothetical protein